MSTSSLDFGLQGVHVLITGASGGIGLVTAQLFLDLGAHVTAHYNTTPPSLPSNPNLVPVQADVTSESAITTLFDTATSHSPTKTPPQILIVNHGIFISQNTSLSAMSLSQWRQTHAVNLDGSFLLCREFLRRLADQPPHILESVCITFTGSTAGKFGEADHADYASSKSALMYGLTLTLKNEIVRTAPRGRVNAVCPGWVATAMAEESLKNEALKARALASTPLQKVAMPKDVAGQIAVVCSPVLSGHVTGVCVMVDGGMEGRCLYPPPNPATS